MKTSLQYTALAFAAAVSFSYACSDSETNENATGNTSSNPEDDEGAGGTGTGGTGTGNDIFVGGGDQGGGDEGGGCVEVELEQTYTYAPSDIIFVIDNSGSMSEEINSVEQNIHINFANIIQASQIDYQVVMVTNHGTGSYDVCIGPPLSGTTNCSGAPVSVANQFYHYDVDVQSHDSVCILLDTFYGPNGGGEADQHAQYPDGWSSVLRQTAVKVFVEITDDRMSCSWGGHNMTHNAYPEDPAIGQTTAVEFDGALLALAPFQFGSVADRNYLWYSIVGMVQNNPATDPWEWYEDVQTTTCGSGCVSPGTGYQWLSKGTKALRFPVSQYASYDSVFQDIAAGVIEGTALPCDIQVTAPMGQTIDWNTLDVIYKEGGMGTGEAFTDVGSEAACGLNTAGYWVDTTTSMVHLCPDTCDRVTEDPMADLDIGAFCGGTTD